MATLKSTKLLLELRMVAASDVRMMAVSEVATAVFCGRPSSITNAGTKMTPPPTPHNAAMTPLRAPMSKHLTMSIDISNYAGLPLQNATASGERSHQNQMAEKMASTTK